MPLALLATFVLASSGPEPSSKPITVTGHSWAPFISPMGEPFRAHSTSDDTLADWFHQADRDHDGILTAAEMVADAERFFATLDTNHDGQIDPDELDRYEWEIAPEIQVNSKTRRPPGESPGTAMSSPDGNDELSEHRRKHSAQDDSSLGLHGSLQGSARYGLLNLPEPVAAADTDFNRAVTLDEFRNAAVERFRLLDRTHQGKLTLEQLEILRQQLQGAEDRRHDDRAPDARLGNPVPGDR